MQMAARIRCTSAELAYCGFSDQHMDSGLPPFNLEAPRRIGLKCLFHSSRITTTELTEAVI